MTNSISDVRVNWCGKDFTLRADWSAMAELERASGESYAVVFARMGSGVPMLTDVLNAFAAFALPRGRHTREGLQTLMPFDGGETLIQAYRHVESAVAAAKPPAAPAGEATGKTEEPQADPQ